MPPRVRNLSLATRRGRVRNFGLWSVETVSAGIPGVVPRIAISQHGRERTFAPLSPDRRNALDAHTIGFEGVNEVVL